MTQNQAKPAHTTIKRFHYWELNGRGQIIGKFPLADGAEPDNRVELHYGADGRVVMIREYLEGFANQLVRQPHFDAQGRISYSDYEGPEAGVKRRNNYEYGPDGLLAVRWEIDRDTNAVTFKTYSKCDANANIREEWRLDKSNKIALRRVYEYDKQGRRTKEVKLSGDTQTGYFVYFYDNAGHEVRREWHAPDGKELCSFVTEYGPHDLPVSATLRFPKGQPTTMAFSYDPAGRKTVTAALDEHGKHRREVRRMPDRSIWAGSNTPVPTGVPAGRGSLLSARPPDSQERADAMLGAAYGYFKRGNFIEALPLFQMLADRYPKDPYFPSAMGLCSLKLYRFEAAFMYYQRALEIDPQHQPSLEGLELSKTFMPYAESGS